MKISSGQSGRISRSTRLSGSATAGNKANFNPLVYWSKV